MKIIPEVKCRRCGETFSSLRSRCPNCGIRRVSQSTRAPGTTPGTVKNTAAYERANANTKWQLLFGMILVVAVILAVIVMVSTSLNGTDSSVRATPNAPVVESANVAPTAEVAPTPSPTPTPNVEKIVIRYHEQEKTEFLMHPGDEAVPLSAYITPMEISATVKWSVADDTILKINVDPDDGNKCTVECLDTINGGCKIYAELGGVKAECIVYCVKK